MKMRGFWAYKKKRGRSKQTNEVSQDARIQRLEAENAYLKKAISYEKGDEVNKSKSVEYEVIHTLKQNFSIVLLCEIAGVSRSGYYKWEKRINDPSEKMKEDQFIMSKIVECERDPDINGSYGYRRICIWLKKVLWFTDKSQKEYIV